MCRSCTVIAFAGLRSRRCAARIFGSFVAIASPMMQFTSTGAQVKGFCISKDRFYIMLTSDQIRAARALVRWSARELAQKAGLSLPTVQRLEAAEGVPSTSVKTLLSVKGALEEAGVEFTNGDTPGVKLRRRR